MQCKCCAYDHKAWWACGLASISLHSALSCWLCAGRLTIAAVEVVLLDLCLLFLSEGFFTLAVCLQHPNFSYLWALGSGPPCWRPS